ncbi:MAG: hypothetical protein SR3Q1_10535 [Quinella sp. 3Q1]|nr:hypothetical protein [Quinella sp. 3Q1]MBR3050020.1 hypothetical protein [Selenomonadaceae bacterium]
MKRGAIKNVGETIACVPHKLLIDLRRLTFIGALIGLLCKSLTTKRIFY